MVRKATIFILVYSQRINFQRKWTASNAGKTQRVGERKNGYANETRYQRNLNKKLEE